MHILLADISYDVYLLMFGKAWGNLVFTRGGGGGGGAGEGEGEVEGEGEGGEV